MKKDISDFIKVCHKCQTNKTKHKMKIPLKITSTSDKPFQKLAMDIVGPLALGPPQHEQLLSNI